MILHQLRLHVPRYLGEFQKGHGEGAAALGERAQRGGVAIHLSERDAGGTLIVDGDKEDSVPIIHLPCFTCSLRKQRMAHLLLSSVIRESC